ncbi:MAG: neutral zinc metallopeptidase, partial [Actinobacteria bacterium]|nr:neutral zinc metallopeptidase [Actinomycetota bacterium]
MELDDVAADTEGIEDRRGRGGGSGGLGGLPLGRGGKVGIPALIVVVLGLVLNSVLGGGGGGGGIDVTGALDQLTPAPASDTVPAAPADTRDAQVAFVAKVRGLLTDYWQTVFSASQEDFSAPGLVIFDQPTPTGCGVGEPEAGPFYCPADRKIYLDFGFYEQLQRQLDFGGDFALAYVLAHEYGHHIQNLLGINRQVQDASAGASEQEANRLSVDLELQADCFAGTWAKAAYEDRRDLLSEGDVDEALGAASAVGDDAIQTRTQGR